MENRNYMSSQKENRGRRICVISSSLRTNEVFSITSTEWSRVQQAAERAVAANVKQKGAELDEEQSTKAPMKMQLRPTRWEFLIMPAHSPLCLFADLKSAP